MKNGKNECCGIVPLEHEISECADPAEIAKKVKLAFKKMPGEMALAGDGVKEEDLAKIKTLVSRYASGE